MTGVFAGSERRARVLCLGNDILGDDAFGIRVAREVEARYGGAGEVVTTSQTGFYILDELLGVARLAVVDCIRSGCRKAGTVYVLDEHAIPPATGGSSHSVGIFDVLGAARRLGLPVPNECVVFAVEAADCTTVGGGMHDDVAAAIPVVVEEIRRFLAGAPAGGV